VVEIGYAALLTAFIVAAYASVASFAGARAKIPELWLSARHGVIATFALTSTASGALLYALLSRDFGVRYVAEYTNSSLSVPYTVAAFWAGQAGSLLLLTWLLSLFGVAVLIQSRERNRALLPYVLTVTMSVEAFFLGIITFSANPFDRLPAAVADGAGLNPLLEDPGMLYHPPILYAGYVAFTVPFAFAVAALISGRLGGAWIRSSRRWTLFAWLTLGLGNLFGAQWAYTVLGWGGYWGWDPVENAGFMPWLVATAFLHSAKAQDRYGVLKVWNMILIIATFSLCLFGTLISRTGIVSSVHAFASGSLGPLLLTLLAMVIVPSLLLLWIRLPLLRGEHKIASMVSREATVSYTNVVFVGAAFAVFCGTVFPLVSEGLGGSKTTVDAAFYNRVAGPLLLTAVALMGVCPLIGWRRISLADVCRHGALPAVASVATAGLLTGFGMKPYYAVITFAVLAFTGTALLVEFYRGVFARCRHRDENPLLALPRLIWADKPRYGGHIVHVGIVVMALGIAGSQLFGTSVGATLSPGESIQVSDYNLTYDGLSSYSNGDKDVVAATLHVARDGDSLGSMAAAKTFTSTRPDQPLSNVAIRVRPDEDLFVILNRWSEDGVTASFTVLVNPLMMWLWIGGSIVLMGAAVAFWPEAGAERRFAVAEVVPMPEMRPNRT